MLNKGISISRPTRYRTNNSFLCKQGQCYVFVYILVAKEKVHNLKLNMKWQFYKMFKYGDIKLAERKMCVGA